MEFSWAKPRRCTSGSGQEFGVCFKWARRRPGSSSALSKQSDRRDLDTVKETWLSGSSQTPVHLPTVNTTTTNATPNRTTERCDLQYTQRLTAAWPTPLNALSPAFFHILMSIRSVCYKQIGIGIGTALICSFICARFAIICFLLHSGTLWFNWRIRSIASLLI